MIKFTKPKLDDIRYQVFMTFSGDWWIYKVEMIKCGRTWYAGKILDHIDGIDTYSDRTYTGEFYYWNYVETLSDAHKMLIYNAFDDREVNLFYRENPDLEQII